MGIKERLQKITKKAKDRDANQMTVVQIIPLMKIEADKGLSGITLDGDISERLKTWVEREGMHWSTNYIRETKTTIWWS